MSRLWSSRSLGWSRAISQRQGARPPRRGDCFHLGVHKTATTHLQNSLAAHRAFLREQGLVFLGPADVRRTKTGVQEAVQGSLCRAPQALLDRVVEAQDRLIVSDENLLGTMERNFLTPEPRSSLYNEAAARVERLVGALNLDAVRLFVALRHPADYYASCYKFHIQQHGFLPWTVYSASRALADVRWVPLIRALRDVEGVAEVIVWRYEDYQAVAPALLEELLGALSPQVTLSAERHNAGPPLKKLRKLYRQAGTPFDFRGANGQPFSSTAYARASARYDREIRRIGGMGRVRLLRPHDVGQMALNS